MAYDLEEQEQIDALKAWWKENGKFVMAVVFAVLATVAGVQGWRYWTQQQSRSAAELYAAVESSLPSGPKNAREAARALMDRQPGSAYAHRAALAAAKVSYDAGEAGEARTLLQWAIDNAKEPALRDAARLRLAAVHYDEQRYDDALRLLEAAPVESYAGLYADLRGDVLLAKGQPAEARSAWEQALAKLGNDPYRDLVQLKLDAGGATR